MNRLLQRRLANWISFRPFRVSDQSEKPQSVIVCFRSLFEVCVGQNTISAAGVAAVFLVNSSVLDRWRVR